MLKFSQAVKKLNEDEGILAWPDKSRLQRIQAAFEGPNKAGFPGKNQLKKLF
jgi:hypothetical protein